MKTIFISGAATGIGLATVHHLDTAGWRVLAGIEPGQDSTHLCEGVSGNLHVIEIDITDDDSVTRAAVEIEAVLEGMPLDGLFNNAGVMNVGPIEGTPLGNFRDEMEINAFSHIRVTQALLPFLYRSEDACIITTASIMARMNTPFTAAYSMSKHALAAFSLTLRMELKQAGIRVTMLEPGAIRTRMSLEIPQRADHMWQALPNSVRSRYTRIFEKMRAAWAHQKEIASQPEMVAALVEQILNDPKPKPRYVVGPDVSIVPLVERLLPGTVYERLLWRQLGF